MSSRAALLLLLLGCGAESTPADRWVLAFNDSRRPYAERVDALLKLRGLRESDPETYRRRFADVKERLWAEVSRWNGMSLSGLEEKALVEALGWHADLGDPGARFQMELHLDRETVKRKRLPEEVLIAIALNLEKYPDHASAGTALWAAFSDAKEKPAVRAACLKSLAAFHPDDLTDRVMKMAPTGEDAWLRGLQAELR